MFPNKFEYFRPETLPAALSLLSTYQDDAKLLAGGQSLLSMMKLRLASPKVLIDLGGIPGLNYVRIEDDAGGRQKIAIGAMTTYAEIRESDLLQGRCALLCQTARWVGDVQVRNRGTLGGSLAHADPAGDMPAAVLALEAEIKAEGPGGERWIRAEDFFVSIFTTSLSSDEIVTEIRVPVLDGYRTAYLKNAPRPSDFAIVGIAARLKLDANRACQDIALGVTGITDKVFRARNVEEKLKGQELTPELIEDTCDIVTDGVDVIGNMHASREFRSHLAHLWVRRTIRAALGE